MRAATRVLGPLVGVALALGAMAPAGAGQPFRDDFSGHRPGDVWAEGSTHGVWDVRFNGYGSVRVVCVGARGSLALQLRPAPAGAPEETHATLVTTREQYRDGVLTMEARTTHQLRGNGAPNPWEVAWVVFRYVDDEHFYYLALKTNGWELGKRDPAYPGGQRFLDTGMYPTFQAGVWASVRIAMAGPAVTVDVDGSRLSTTVDTERPILSGGLGMYTEDAEVQFDNVSFVGA